MTWTLDALGKLCIVLIGGWCLMTLIALVLHMTHKGPE